MNPDIFNDIFSVLKVIFLLILAEDHKKQVIINIQGV